MNVEKVIPQRVRELRVSRGLEQQELARIVGITKQAFNHYELGDRKFPHTVIAKIADYFDVSIDYIYGRTDDPR